MATTPDVNLQEGADRRVLYIGTAIVLVYGILLYQLWQLQVVERLTYQGMAQEQSSGPERLKADRGIIYDRKNKAIADNRASVDIAFVPGDCSVKKEAQERVCTLLAELLALSGRERDDLFKKLNAAAQTNEPFRQILVKQDVRKEERVLVEEQSHRLPGVLAIVHPVRRYPYGESAGHILGYLGEIGEGEVESWDGYQLFDMVGRNGVERTYENVLHGADGFTVVTKYAAGRPQLRTDERGIPFVAQRDSMGHELQEQSGMRQDPLPGRPLNLTLDMKLQQYCESLLAGQVGSIVALEAETGAVLALASTPGYNPSVFVDRAYSKERGALISSGRMYHRAIQGTYPPGSTFKIVVALAALELGLLNEGTTHGCDGRFYLDSGAGPWKCHGRHGAANVVGALTFSCDEFFYNVGLSLGRDRIDQYARAMGYGAPTGIDLPGEQGGVFPDPAWKKKQFANKPPSEWRWYQGETVNLSIGQGYLTSTPLQVAVMMACVLNGGHRVTPRLNADAPVEKSERLFSEKTVQTVIKGLRQCVERRQSPHPGTGRDADIPGIMVIGKTGTAQAVGNKFQDRYANELDIPYEMRDHAWFVAGVLDKEPKIAVCVMVEHGLHGGWVAPLARKVIASFYESEGLYTPPLNAPPPPPTLEEVVD